MCHRLHFVPQVTTPARVACAGAYLCAHAYIYPVNVCALCVCVCVCVRALECVYLSACTVSVRVCVRVAMTGTVINRLDQFERTVHLTGSHQNERMEQGTRKHTILLPVSGGYGQQHSSCIPHAFFTHTAAPWARL